MTIYLSLLVCLIGGAIYAFATNAKLTEIGRMTFFAGLLAFLLKVGEPMISLFGK